MKHWILLGITITLLLSACGENNLTRPLESKEITIDGVHMIVNNRFASMYYIQQFDQILHVWMVDGQIKTEWDMGDFSTNGPERHAYARFAYSLCQAQQFAGEVIVLPIQYDCASLQYATIPVDPEFQFDGWVNSEHVRLHEGGSKIYFAALTNTYIEYSLYSGIVSTRTPELAIWGYKQKLLQAQSMCTNGSGLVEAYIMPIHYDCLSIATIVIPTDYAYSDLGITVTLSDDVSEKIYYVPSWGTFVRYTVDPTTGLGTSWQTDLPEYWKGYIPDAQEKCLKSGKPEVTIQIVTFDCASIKQ
jgi:hypothetical protein